MNRKLAVALLLAALPTALLLSACGGSDDENTTEGEFAVLEDAPSGFEEMSGTAEMTRSDDGTEASISFQGLRPDTEYVAHVHGGICDQPDPGGPHFKFDINGPEEPPNEIHFSFTSDADGAGSAEAQNDQTVPEDEGNTIVLHLAEAEGEDVPEHSHGDEAMGSDSEMKDGGSHTHSHTHDVKVACADLS